MNNAFGAFVVLPDRCPNCNCNTAFASHQRLLCSGCECGRGRISAQLRSFLESFVRQFGRPDRPIILRTGKVCEPEPPAPATEPVTVTERKRKKEMRLNELFPGKYLKAADLKDKPRVVTIEKVTYEDFKDDGRDVKKAVLHFEGGDTAPVVVNKTNFQMLSAITGEDDSSDWVGTEIELRSQKVMGPGGKVVDSIRVHEAG